ncbi:uncharacterized protein METZ01_LOCUS226450, partial [marine metagenome]
VILLARYHATLCLFRYITSSTGTWKMQNSTFPNSRSHTTEEALKESYSAP